jgi:Kdo2-lipid IVA lauroyltransferase/acyltransferase
VIGRLPAGLARWIGRRLGDVGYALAADRRRTALANLARAFPGVPDVARRRICRGSFQHLGLMLVELAALLARPLEHTLRGVRIEGLDRLRSVMDRHGRALVVTAHLGNWELLPVACRLTGYRLSVVVRPLDAPRLDRLARRLRERSEAELIDKRAALRPVLRALAGGGMVGILLDQNAARREGVFVPFFGHPASTSKSLAVLALRTGSPIVPAFIHRQAAGTHRVVIGEPLVSPVLEDHEAAVASLTARCTEAIEAAIRNTPEQWLWMHDRWRTRPPRERATE